MKQAKSLVSGRRLTYVTPDMSVSETTSRMAAARIGAVIVLDNSELVGIFTERDLLNRVVSVGKDPQKTRISDVMTKDVAVCNADDTYESCLAQMRQIGCRHMPVVEENQLLGVLSIRDLLRHHISVQEAEIKMMNSLYRYQPPDMEY
jgi:CBS domain-containing protein